MELQLQTWNSKVELFGKHLLLFLFLSNKRYPIVHDYLFTYGTLRALIRNKNHWNYNFCPFYEQLLISFPCVVVVYE